MLDADGNRQNTHYTATYDGRDYPVSGTALIDTASEQRVDREGHPWWFATPVRVPVTTD